MTEPGHPPPRAIVPLFPDEIATELARLASATDGAAVLVTPTFDLALVRGELTDEAAQLARTKSPSAPGWIGEAASFSCDDASWLHVLRVTGGWTLGLQSRSGRDVPTIGEELRRSRNTLTILLAYVQPTGATAAGSATSGAPTEASVARTAEESSSMKERKRRKRGA